VRALQEAINTAEKTSKSAKKAAKASMTVFEKAISGGEKVSKISKEEIEEAVEVVPEMLEEALSKTETGRETKTGPKQSRREIQSRLDFLARMYAASKTEPAEAEAEESDVGEQD